MQLQPAEWAVDSVEVLLAEKSGGGWVYVAIIALVLSAVISLPLVRVPVTVRASGVLRPAAEVYEIRAGVSGAVAELSVGPHDLVAAGDTVARVDVPGPRAELAAARAELSDIDRSRAGLTALRSDSDQAEPASALVRDRLLLFRGLEQGLVDRIEARRRALSRASELHARGLLADAELDQYIDDLAIAERELTTSRAERRARIDEELRVLDDKRRQVVERITRLEIILQAAHVIAPLAGTIEALWVAERGVFVSAGDPIALISPDTSIVGIVHLTDRDVPHVQVGQPVRLSFHSFPSSVWGTADGVLSDISNDLLPGKEHATFAATIRLDRDTLRSRASEVAHLRKGLGFEAHFTVQRRSLLSFLREDLARLLAP